MRELYTLDDLSKILRKSKSVINHNWKIWKHEGRIGEVLMIGRSPRFPELSVKRLINSFKVDD